MKTKTKFTCGLMSLAVVVMIGCSKPKDGAQGPQGVSGTNGTNGTNGNANVKSDFIYATVWVSAGTNLYSCKISVPDISDALNDAVMLYYQPPASSSYFALPASSLINAGDELSFSIQNGFVTMFYSSSKAPGQMGFKVVVIPPAMKKNYNVELDKSK